MGVEACERGGHLPKGLLPARKPTAHTPRAVGEPRATVRVAKYPCERPGEGRGVPGRRQQAGVIANEVGNRSGRRTDDGESVRQRLGDRHPVGLSQCRQDEHVGAFITFGQSPSVEVADERYPLLQPQATHRGAHTLDRCRMPC